jgi:salicylate hydroxylase
MSAGKRSIATTERLRIAVVGGGIAGLTAALAFAERGFEVRVYEQAEALTETGAGLQITPNGFRVLDALGVGDDLRRVGVPAEGVDVRSGVSGKSLSSIDFAADQYLFVWRPDLIDVLARHVRASGVDLQLGAAVRSADLDADLVVAADGVHSRHRLALNPNARPRFSGMVAWRATFDGTAYPRARLITAPRGHVVLYPVRKGLINLVAVSEVEQWAGEGWSQPATLGEMQGHFAHLAPEIRTILARPNRVQKWGLRNAPVATNWQDGRVVLIGDAAHPTLPFLAQGANMAIEDAAVLARIVAAEGLSALPRFQAARLARTSRIVEAASANGRIYHARGLARLAVESALRLMPKARLQHRTDWIYDFDWATD